MTKLPIKNQLRLGLLILSLFSTLLTASDTPIIAAASSTRFALQDIAQSFHQDTGKTVRISYSSSGNLTRQIEQGGPFELFLSANAAYVSQLHERHKTLNQGIVFAFGRMVILTTNTSTLSLDEQLLGIKKAIQKGQIKHFAIANPEFAPFGVAAQEILRQLNLWTLVHPSIVQGDNVAQAAQFAISGAAQAGLVSYSLALAPSIQKHS
ncbi:MAG: molybdate ABC transporter substrate-binding protein, partial [Gammaproteobacteria bacterium]